MKRHLLRVAYGYTVIELMVMIAIVTVLAATVGTFVVMLLTFQEQDREGAYVREKLVEICGAYADYLSIASTVSNVSDQVGSGFVATYRQETGGVSLETGRVTRVTRLTSFAKLNVGRYQNRTLTYRSLGLNVDAHDRGPWYRELRGDDTPLLTVKDLGMNDVPVDLSCSVTPIINASAEDVALEDVALWYLQVRADYAVKRDNGELAYTNVTAKRVVRLWNRE